MRRLLISFRLLITVICFVAVFTALNKTASANGAVWNSGVKPGSPGPIKVNDLVLIEEYVLFDTSGKKVSAQFWIYNPTNKDIHVTMGFPLRLSADSPNYQSREEYLAEFSRNFRVEVNDVTVSTKYILEESIRYPIVFTWDMTFPARKTTEYTVQYPLTFSIDEADHELGSGRSGYQLSRSFTYISHTGAYWAKPIKLAKFEYCDKGLVELMQRAPTGEICTEKRDSSNDTSLVTTILDRWSVKPKPYKIDADKGCIVWTRKEWAPRISDDDIAVSTYHDDTASEDINKLSFCQLLAELNEHPQPRPPKPPSIEKDAKLDDMFNKWCGVSGDSVKAKHFGATEKITEIKLTAEIFYNMWERAFYYPDGKPSPQFGSQYAELPANIRAAFQVQLSRYLRNYIFAVHGHVFKDQHLAQCFQNISESSTTKLSGAEKWNVDWLLDYEKQFRE